MSVLALSRGFAVCAQFAVQIIVGYVAGAAALGSYQLFTVWSAILGEGIGRGLPTGTMKKVSVNFAEGKLSSISNWMAWSCREIIRGCVPLFLLFVLFSLAARIAGLQVSDTALAFCGGVLLAAPLFALSRVYAEALKAIERQVFAVAVENLMVPAFILLLCGVYVIFGLSVNEVALLMAFSAAVLSSYLIMRRALLRSLYGLLNSSKGTESCLPHSRELKYFWLIGLLNICSLQMPFLVLPLFADLAEIGVFALAFKFINVVTTILLLLSAVYSPRMARAAAIHDVSGLRSLLQQTQLISVCVFVPLTAFIYLSSGYISEYLGEDFVGVKAFYLILAVGYLFNAATGLQGVLLNMAGAAKFETIISVIVMVVSFFAALAFGHQYGVTGVAMVFTCAIALKNIASYLVALYWLNHLEVASRDLVVAV